jgi:glycyl-tRNA synthetase beta chain
MRTKDFLFEIGVEEIPAGYIKNALEKMNSYFVSQLQEAKLSYNSITLYTTPRRLVIKILELQVVQDDEVIEKLGPSKIISFDSEGNLTSAALGFLKGTGAREEDLFFKKTPKGEKIAVIAKNKGKKAEMILRKIVSEVMKKISFPKSMRWNAQELSFARPIRWILALFGDEILHVEINGLKTGHLSYGNRFQKLDNFIEIKKIGDYEKALKSVFVYPNREERKLLILEQIEDLFRNTEMHVVQDNRLLEVVTDLVEYPTAVKATFDMKYLTLPKQVITSTLSQHQKYFAVANAENELVNKFVFISNGNPENSNIIRLGNEKVVKARLEDAEFFFKEDTKKPLESFLIKLVDVTFQEKLGTLSDKSNRIKKLVDFLCEELKIEEDIRQRAIRTAQLCKADLVTLMIGEKEFTHLQGYMGWKYAEKSGEQEPVPQAIYEHYLPRWQKDQLPATTEGALVAIADKIDSVCGIIGVNLIPTSSKDPFALRRAASGVVQIIENKNYEIDLILLIDHTFEILKNRLGKPDNNKKIVYDFFKQRINWLLQEKNIDYDIIESVMHIDHSNIPDLIHRAAALQNFKQRNDFIKLVIGFKRVSNIIINAKNLKDIIPDLFIEGSEKELYENYLLLKKKIPMFLKKKDYKNMLEELVIYGSNIDKFFDDVLVNIENKELRENRYNLLNEIKKLFLKVADISKIVVDG